MADNEQQKLSMNGASNLSPEEYKELCKRVKQYQLKNTTKKKAKPLLKPIGDVNSIALNIKCQKSPCDWETLKNGMPFSLDASGTVLYTKTGKERAICLNTMQPVPVGGASVYRVFL